MAINITPFEEICSRYPNEDGSSGTVDFYRGNLGEIHVKAYIINLEMLQELLTEVKRQNLDMFLSGEDEKALLIALTKY